MVDVLDAAKGSPFLLAGLVIFGALVYGAEKLGGVNGPMTRAWAAWRNRELNRLRREALLRAERAKIAREEQTGVVGDLVRQVERLQAEVTWLEGEGNDNRRRDRARDAHDRAMSDYVHRLLNTARAAGVPFADPPPPLDLAPLLVVPDDLSDEQTASQ
jgi:hypothetical protein